MSVRAAVGRLRQGVDHARRSGVGSAAGDLDLEGEVDPDDLRALWEGLDPRTGERLGPLRGRKVRCYDLSFKAPKSVSLLYAFGGTEIGGAVRDAHDAAVLAALAYIEANALASRTGAQGGGRVVKLIGDEVMHVAQEPAAAASMAVELVDWVAADDRFPGARAGVAFGEVVARSGDYFVPIVNLAARTVSAAAGEVLVTEAVADRLRDARGWQLRSRGSTPLKGFDEPIELVAVARVERLDCLEGTDGTDHAAHADG